MVCMSSERDQGDNEQLCIACGDNPADMHCPSCTHALCFPCVYEHVQEACARRYGIIGALPGHKWFVLEAGKLRCECGARLRDRASLAAHVRLESLLAS
jgi:hypothetical protein